MMGVAGALQAPTLSLFLSREVGAQPFWVGLFYTVNAIVGIVVSLGLAKRSDSQGDRRKLIMFCCLMAIGNALLFAFNRHYLTLITCGVLLASLGSVGKLNLALAKADGRLHVSLGLRLVPGDVYMLLATISWAFYSWLLARTSEPATVRQDWAAFLMAQMVFGLGW